MTVDQAMLGGAATLLLSLTVLHEEGAWS